MFISQGVKELVADMVENPNNWEQSTYYFEHKIHHDICIWTANGVSFLRFGWLAQGATFNIFEKFYIRAGIKLSHARKIKSK